MKIAVFSDTHDNIPALEWVLAEAQERGAQHGIHCGDLTGTEIVAEMMFASFPIFAVCGNNDIYNAEMLAAHASGSTCTLVPEMYGDVEIGGQKIFACHYPDVAERAAQTGKYDAVFYGHTHRPEQHTANKTLVCNSGELQGRFGVLSFALYDTETREIEFITKEKADMR